jgi:two-component system, chemotaxis family, chemotaxis protein CheY
LRPEYHACTFPQGRVWELKVKSEIEKKKILLIEDDESTSTSLALLFELEGLEVISAQDGLDGFEKAANSRPSPDVILTDIDTPNMNGLEFIRLVKADTSIRHIPVIAMTAATRDVLAKAAALGAIATYQKPFDFEQLLETIRQLLPKTKDPNKCGSEE